MRALTFLQRSGLYVPRDVAFFEDDVAEQLLKGRTAAGAVCRAATDAEIKAGRQSIDPEDYQGRDKRDPVPVMFDRSVIGYNMGEIAWFPPSIAEGIVAAMAGHYPTKLELKSAVKKNVERASVPRVMVRTLRPIPPLNRGEVASYPLPEARHFIAKGFAEPADEEAAALLAVPLEAAEATT